MSYEVDWRAVGDESKSGDCITFRFGNFLSNPKDQTIVVIDGGFRETGEDLVKFIKEVYGSDKVDIVISTHPDNDHLSGLNVVLEELRVGELWMHKPWEREDDIRAFIVDEGVITKREFDEAVSKSLIGSHDLAELAETRGIPIYEPFQGRQAFDGLLTILGPTEDFYNQMLADIGAESGFRTAIDAAKRGIVELAKRALVWIVEDPDIELLSEPGENATTPRNNSSVISLARLEGTMFMFTADAGVPALNSAVDYAESWGYSVASDFSYVQVPHHGSKRNVGPLILDRLYGPRISGEKEKRNKMAVVLAARQGAPKHPNGRITNALNRRCVEVAVTAGEHIVNKSIDVPDRDGWRQIELVEFQSRFEDEE